MTFLGGNSWDWLVFFLLLVFGYALGLKDGDERVIPIEVIVRSVGVFVLILVVFNLPTILSLFF